MKVFDSVRSAGDSAPSFEPSPRIRLGISSCLLGHKVRYDGQHKYDPFLAETLGPYVEYVPVCPEFECGLGVPRESMRLVGDPAAPRLVTHTQKIDLTDRMLAWVEHRLVELEKEDLCGYVFKAKSPSSGMEKVKVYTNAGGTAGYSAGLFAGAFQKRFPLLPVEDEGRLHDPGLRENFIERIFILDRYRRACVGARTLGALTEFHARAKYLIMSHSDPHLRRMGRLLAGATRADLARTRAEYEGLLLEALKLMATPAKHSNSLQHMMGHFKNVLSTGEKQELQGVITAYRQGHVPLIVPITLIRHYVRKYAEPYLALQFYLNPYPAEMKLRNHA